MFPDRAGRTFAGKPRRAATPWSERAMRHGLPPPPEQFADSRRGLTHKIFLRQCASTKTQRTPEKHRTARGTAATIRRIFFANRGSRCLTTLRKGGTALRARDRQQLIRTTRLCRYRDASVRKRFGSRSMDEREPNDYMAGQSGQRDRSERRDERQRRCHRERATQSRAALRVIWSSTHESQVAAATSPGAHRSSLRLRQRLPQKGDGP